MSKPDLSERYAEIVAEADERASGQASALDRRGAPRVSVTCGEVAVNSQFSVTTVDVSTSGACFLSEQQFPVGAEISVRVANVFSLTATVVDCVMEETDAMFLETRYRVRCHFQDETQGMELLVLAKERESVD